MAFKGAVEPGPTENRSLELSKIKTAVSEFPAGRTKEKKKRSILRSGALAQNGIEKPRWQASGKVKDSPGLDTSL